MHCEAYVATSTLRACWLIVERTCGQGPGWKAHVSAVCLSRNLFHGSSQHEEVATALQVIEAGANALVAGSAVFKAPSYVEGTCPHATAPECARIASYMGVDSVGYLQLGSHKSHSTYLTAWSTSDSSAPGAAVRGLLVWTSSFHHLLVPCQTQYHFQLAAVVCSHLAHTRGTVLHDHGSCPRVPFIWPLELRSYLLPMMLAYLLVRWLGADTPG